MAFTKINAAGIGTTETVTVDGLTVINNGSFGGNLTVSGVLTYEDVTNVDSVGLITARNGIVVGSGITLSKDGDIFATGITTVSGNVKVGTGITLSPDGDGFYTGVVTATTFKGNGSQLTGVNSDVVDDTSPQLGGNLDVNSKTINLGDSSGETVNRIRLGADNDGDLFHDGTDLLLREVDSGQILLRSDGAKVFANANGSENQAIFRANGNVELYYDNERKIYTHASGIQVEDATSTGASIVMSTSSGTSGSLYATGDNTLGLLDGQNHYMLKGIKDGAVELYYDNSKVFETTSVGVNITGQSTFVRNAGDANFIVGSTNASGAYLVLDGDSNGDAAGGDYAYLLHNSSGNLIIDSRNPGGNSKIIFNNNGSEKFSIQNDGRFWLTGADMGGTTSYPSSSSGARIQVGAHTFSGTHAVYANNRLGMQINGDLSASIMLADVYNNASFPGYGYVMVQGPSTSDYVSYAICPDGPAKGNNMNFHIGEEEANIHSGANTRQVWFNAGGNAYKRNNTTVWSTTSDERLKKNIVDNNKGLAEINQLRVASFEYRKEEEIDMSQFPLASIPRDVVIEGEEGPHTGVIAQEIESIFPECVQTSEKGAKTVDADAITWALVNAVKELSAKNDALEAEIAALKG